MHEEDPFSDGSFRGCVAKTDGTVVKVAFILTALATETRSMNPKQPFKWRHFQSDIILLCVRWYLRYPLSYRHLEEMMLERGLTVDHSTIYRWVQYYAAELDKRCRPYLRPTNDSWRVDETYIEVKGKWKYLYRAVDSLGNTLDFMLSAKRDARAAGRFFRKVLNAEHNQTPRVINVDKNAAYPPAINELKQDQTLLETTELRRVKYLNNMVEQDHRFIKRLGNVLDRLLLPQTGKPNS